MHYGKHSWDEVLQDFCLLGHNFICNLLRQRQNALHSIAKTRGHLVILVLCFQELNPQTLLSASSSVLGARTHLKRDPGKTDDSLGNWVQLSGINIISFHGGVGQLTSAMEAPYLIAMSTVFSVEALIIGAYFSSKPSSSRSDKRRASAYTK